MKNRGEGEDNVQGEGIGEGENQYGLGIRQQKGRENSDARFRISGKIEEQKSGSEKERKRGA